MKLSGRLLFLIFGLALLGGGVYSPALGSPERPGTCINLLDDPGFEAYTPNPYWTEYSINTSTPLCLLGVPECGGSIFPRSGNGWAFFGRGTVPDEYAFLMQTVTIPQGSATLSLYLAMQAPEGSGEDDRFFVTIGLTEVVSINATQAAEYSDYKLVSVDVSAFADGLEHDIYLEVDTWDELVYFHVDDVTLCEEALQPSNQKNLYLPITISPSWVTEAPDMMQLDPPWVHNTYTIEWSSVEGADVYVLQEDTDMLFSNPRVVYEGPDTSWTATWRAETTYWYRVSGKNIRGNGPWSTTNMVAYEGVYADADAGIVSGSNSNYGSNEEFIVGYNDSTCPWNVSLASGAARGLLWFDTSGVPVDLDFSKVELYLYLGDVCYLNTLLGSTRTLTLYRVAAPWLEDSVTWANAPATAESVAAVDITLISYDETINYYSFDITGMVRNWLNGSQPNYGLMLRSSSESAGAPIGFLFRTLESEGAVPYLSVAFNAADTAHVEAQLAQVPTGERQCVVSKPGEMLCTLKVR